MYFAGYLIHLYMYYHPLSKCNTFYETLTIPTKLSCKINFATKAFFEISNHHDIVNLKYSVFKIRKFYFRYL